MRWPIRYQILIPFAGMILVAGLCVSVLNAYWAAARSQQQIEEQLRGVAQTLLGSSFPLTQNVLQQMRGLAGAEFVLSDGAGNRLATSGLAGEDLPALDNTDDLALYDVDEDWPNLRLGPLVTLGNERFFHVTLRADRRGSSQGTGLLHILYPQRVLREARRQAALPPLVVGGVALVVCVALAGWIAGRLSLPLDQVRTQVSRMAEGDFHPLPVPLRNDEVRDVAQSVNELGRQLDEMRRVIARTERLSILGRLSGGLAHHLRNDVTGALMAVQMHQRHCRTSDQESLGVALRQLSLIEEHLKRFLAAGQPEQPQLATFNPHDLLDELLVLVMPTAQHRRVALSCEERGASVTLCADRDQLRQALLNLLLNALEAVGTEGQVRVELVTDAERVRLLVLDNGPGLDPEIAQRLGEAFQTTKPEGVGLGLTVARQVAEAHGGSIRYSRTGNMTCFELSLPIAPPDSAPPRLLSAAGRAAVKDHFPVSHEL